MESYATRRFREKEEGHVEGQFVIHGTQVKYLDLPSEPEEGSLTLILNGTEELDETQIRVLPKQRILSLKSRCFQEGDELYFSYQRDPSTIWKPSK